MNHSTPGFLSFTISWSLLKLMSIESVMPSNQCIQPFHLLSSPPLKTLVFRCFVAKEVSLTCFLSLPSWPTSPQILSGDLPLPRLLWLGGRGVFSELSFVVSTEGKREAGELWDNKPVKPVAPFCLPLHPLSPSSYREPPRFSWDQPPSHFPTMLWLQRGDRASTISAQTSFPWVMVPSRGSSSLRGDPHWG